MVSKSLESPGVFLGVDVGSVSTKLVLLDAGSLSVVDNYYTRTHGDPLESMKRGMQRLAAMEPRPRILAAGTTGSGRQLAARLVNTPIVKNEITAHTLAAGRIDRNVRTVVEIGGQDSKIILVRNGMAVDFAMNTVCAAGTGSFLDQQAGRLGIPVEKMGTLALSSARPAEISGRCTVFAETDMVHKQQIGIPVADIVAGLCRSLVKNYLASVARGKAIEAPVVFQGGVAANRGIVRELERQTGLPVTVSPFNGVEGALGAALLASMAAEPQPSFAGFDLIDKHFAITSFTCEKCEETCSVVVLKKEGRTVSCWNDRCGRYSEAPA